jgi:alkanesulfonate monooxygenase SsuD/methylene tetrahydromethanopterin reductase-like flavin-dependent oxidoreductase (luciferase family)
MGIGAGWFAAEHEAYGIPFPPNPERFDMLEEALEIVTGLWSTPIGQRFDFAGEHWTVRDSPGLPKPVQQPGPPIIMGGFGKRRTPELAVRYAAEFNTPFGSLDEVRGSFARVRAACEERGRDPETLILSSAEVLCCGADEAELARRAKAIGREVEDLRATSFAGTPSALVDRLGAYAEAGLKRAYLQMLDLTDLDHLELVASEVMPHV